MITMAEYLASEHAEHPITLRQVVLCKDCIYKEPSKKREEEFPYFCTIHREHFKDGEEFCSYGRAAE